MSRYNSGTIEFTPELKEFFLDAGNFKNSEIPNRGTFSVVYGFDHALLYFVDFFPKDRDAELEVTRLTGQSGKDNVPISFDTIFTKLTGAKLGLLLGKTSNKNQVHIDACYMDMPF